MSGLYEGSKSATEKLIDALVYGLKQIKSESGYDTTVRDVFTEIPTQSQLVNYPSIAVIQGKESTDWDETESLANNLTIILMVFIKDQSNPTAARLRLKKDIHRHFGLNWMVRGEDDIETCRLIRPLSYEPFGMFLNAPNVGFIMELKVMYNQDVNDPTIAV